MDALDLIIPSDDQVTLNARLTMCVGAARKDATPAQLVLLRQELLPVVHRYAEHDPAKRVSLRDVLEKVQEIMGPEWEPGEEWNHGRRVLCTSSARNQEVKMTLKLCADHRAMSGGQPFQLVGDERCDQCAPAPLTMRVALGCGCDLDIEDPGRDPDGLVLDCPNGHGHDIPWSSYALIPA